MKLKTLKKKIRKLEARLQEGPVKLAKLKQKLEAMTKAKAMKAKRKAAVRASKAREMAKSLTPIQKKKDGLTQSPVKLAGATRRTGKKVKRKLNLSPESTKKERSQFVKNSVLHKQFLTEREEILKHKWIESEKAGKEIGFEEAARDWIANHRAKWLQERLKQVLSQRASDQHTSRARGVV